MTIGTLLTEARIRRKIVAKANEDARTVMIHAIDPHNRGSLPWKWDIGGEEDGQTNRVLTIDYQSRNVEPSMLSFNIVFRDGESVDFYDRNGACLGTSDHDGALAKLAELIAQLEMPNEIK